MRSAVSIWKWRIITAIAVLAVAITFSWSASAATQTKVALIIGNGAYKGVPELPNPTNDATAVAGAFLRLGFSVRLVTDASYDEMRRALLEFSQKARDSEMAVVFFAGHGIELGGENWLIPVDAELKTDLDTEQEAISLRSVMLMVSAASKLGVVMLDACRNNPFINKVKRSLATRGVTRGLSRVEPMNNVLVAYAARDGTTASDGSGDHSPFTTALLKHLETPGLEVTFLFRNVRDDVIAATGNEQQPFVYGSLSKEAIYFKPPPAVAAPMAPDQIAWSMLKETTDEAALKRFATQYPKSELRKDAEARIAALEAAQAAKPVPAGPDETTWALLKETTDEAALKRFTAQYPNSALRKDAEARIAALAAAQAAKPVPPSPDEVTWALLKETTDEAALKRFTAQYPKSPLRKDAEARIAALEAAQAAKPVPPKPDELTWAWLKDTTDEAALKRFTAQYPDSALRKQAEARVAALEATQAAKPVPPKPDEVTWALIKETTDEAALKRFTKQYPDSALRKDAEARIAALEPAAKVGPASVTDPHELARSLQFELKRVGCFNGAINGEFDDATKAAWGSFSKHASIKLPDDLSSEAIKAIRAFDKRICPLVCPNGQRPDGDRCVVTAQSSGAVIPAKPSHAAVPASRCPRPLGRRGVCFGPNNGPFIVCPPGCPSEL
jgi:outer membrane protein assembly factor BamD (BamD/ComL family)